VTIPPNGVLRLKDATDLFDAGGCAGGLSAMEVRDGVGTVVLGEVREVEVLGEHFWVPAETLAPASAYDVWLEPTMGLGDRLHFVLTTTATAALPPSTLQVEASALQEWEEVSRGCCTPKSCEGMSSCRTPQCWDEAYAYWPSIRLEVSTDAEGSGPYYLRVSSANGTQVWAHNAFPRGEPLVLRFDGQVTYPLCYVLELHDSLSEAVLLDTEEACFSEEALERVARRTPALVDFSTCINPSDYADHPLNLLGGKSKDDGCSCQVQRRTAASGPLALLCTLALGLLWGWRRRERRG